MTKEQRLDAIRRHAEKLEAVAKGYRRLVMVAEREEATEAMLALTEAAGFMASTSLTELATTLELLYEAGERDNPDKDETPWFMRGFVPNPHVRGWGS